MEEAITALLASVAGGKRYWGRAPQTASRPYVVMYRIDGLLGYTYGGSDDLVSSRVQANCFGDTYTTAKATARALIATLDGYKGGIIQGIFIDNEGRDLAVSDAGEVTNLFAIAVDFVVHHQAS